MREENAAEEIELVAQLHCLAKCVGEPQILSEEEMAKVGEKFKTYANKGWDIKVLERKSDCAKIKYVIKKLEILC